MKVSKSVHFLKHLTAIICFSIVLFLESCHVGRFVIYNFADWNDYKKFPSNTVHKGSDPFYFAHTSNGKQIDIDIPGNIKTRATESFEDNLYDNGTVAFLVIRNDTILYEQYFRGRDSSAIHSSFSMSKSVVSALLGIAIEEGYINSVNDPITKYIPELTDSGFRQITLLHLLNMRTGIDYKESYFNPFGEVAKYYYGRHIDRYNTELTLKGPPDKDFDYISAAPQLLGMAISRASGVTLSEYLERKIWIPLGMESDASWTIDRKGGNERAFCCLNGIARDFAKFGRLFLNGGKWDNSQIVPSAWVEKSTHPTVDGQSYYSYQWWLTKSSFAAIGFLGQYVYVVPEKRIIIVRLGERQGKLDWYKVFASIVSPL